MIPCAHLRMSVQMRALPSITHWVLCVRSKRRTPPGLTLRSEAAGDGCGNSADTCAAIKKKKIDWGSELSRTRGDHRRLSLFCGGERAHVRACVRASEREKRTPRRTGGRK